jgi:hypothetical protein
MPLSGDGDFRGVLEKDRVRRWGPVPVVLALSERSWRMYVRGEGYGERRMRDENELWAGDVKGEALSAEPGREAGWMVSCGVSGARTGVGATTLVGERKVSADTAGREVPVYPPRDSAKVRVGASNADTQCSSWGTALVWESGSDNGSAITASETLSGDGSRDTGRVVDSLVASESSTDTRVRGNSGNAVDPHPIRSSSCGGYEPRERRGGGLSDERTDSVSDGR